MSDAQSAADVEADQLRDPRDERTDRVRIAASKLGGLLAHDARADELAAQPMEWLGRDLVRVWVYEGQTGVVVAPI